MQVHYTTDRGLVDAFTIAGSVDNHNGIELDYKWRVAVFDNIKNAKIFAAKHLDTDIKKGEFTAITIPLKVFSTVKNKKSTFSIDHPNIFGYILCLDKEVDTEVIAHECYHAAWCTFLRCVKKIDFYDHNQQEVIAYLLGQLVKSFCNEYSDRESRARFFRPKPSTKNKKRVQRTTRKVSRKRK